MNPSSHHDFPPPNPRIQGVHEQYDRARWFLRRAHRYKDSTARFRLLMAAVYAARAIVEIMLDAAKRHELRGFQMGTTDEDRNRYEETLVRTLPWYYLIEKIRIHDFHRFGLIPPDSNVRVSFCGGPIKLVARRGMAALAVQSEGPQTIATAGSTVKMKRERPLFIDDGRFFDDESRTYMPLENILRDFLDPIPDVIEEFKRLLAD